jgi:hypothetical protein
MPVLAELLARKVRLGLLDLKVCKASLAQPGPHLSSALSAHPAKVLQNARLHVATMKSLSLHFVGQKEPSQTISLSIQFHAGLIRIRPAVHLSWSARSSDEGADLLAIPAHPHMAICGQSDPHLCLAAIRPARTKVDFGSR